MPAQLSDALQRMQQATVARPLLTVHVDLANATTTAAGRWSWPPRRAAHPDRGHRGGHDRRR